MVAEDHVIPVITVVAELASVFAALLSALKGTDDSPESGSLVTGWDDTQLSQLCLPLSPLYDSSICLSTLF